MRVKSRAGDSKTHLGNEGLVLDGMVWDGTIDVAILLRE